MPLPKLGGGTPRLSTDVRPRPTQSIEQAGMVGKAVTNLAVQASDFGSTLLAKRQAAKKNEYISKKMIDLYQQESDITAEAQRRFSDDHEGYTEFVRSEMEKVINSMSKDAPFSEAQEAFGLKANSFLASAVSQSSAYENKKRVKFYDDSDNEKIKEAGYSSFQQPDLLKGEEKAMLLELHFQGNEQILYNQDQIDIKRKAAKENIAAGTMWGFMEMGRFDTAVQMVQDNYLGAFDTPEKTEKALQQIRSRQMQVTNDRLRLENIAKKAQKEAFEKQEDESVRQIMLASMDGDQGKANKLFEEAVRAGSISPQQLRVTKNQFLNPMVKKKAQEYKALFFRKMTSPGANLNSLSKDLTQAAISGQIPAEMETTLRRDLEIRRNRAKNNPGQQLRMRAGDKVLNRSFQLQDFEKFNPDLVAKNNEQYFEALNTYTSLVGKGIDPLTAAQSAIKKAKGSVDAQLPQGSIPGVNFSDFSNPDKYHDIKNKIYKMFKTGNNAEKAKAKEFAQAIKAREEAVMLKDVPLPEELEKLRGE